MFQEFNKVTTTSNFIKNLLISTYLPLIRTVRDFDYIIKDRLYVYKCEIIKCTKSGYLLTGYKNVKFDGDRAAYRVVTEYYFGERNDKLCTNYISNSEGYDSITHERLGKYLRSLRDMYDLNLMPLYNCFSNQILQAHHITSARVEKTAADYNTKIYKIPIRFNTDYTICMDNLGLTTFAPAFIKNNNLVFLNNTRFGNNVDATNKYIRLHRTNVIQNIANSRFKTPFIIRYNNVPETKHVTYFEKSLKEIDYLHDNIYYRLNTTDTLPRMMYYIKNSGDYIVDDNITAETFLANPTNYYYSNNGIITQCNQSDNFNVNLVYFTINSDSSRSTYLPTNLTPETAGNTVLYIGVEPDTGRIDSTFSFSKTHFWQDDRTLYTDINTYVEELSLKLGPEFSALYEDGSLVIDVDKIRVYDSPGYRTVCLWSQCNRYSIYDENETYYIRENNVFNVWNYLLSESEFNSNKSFYYVKEDDVFVNCAGKSYSASETYYVYSNETYITSKEYYFTLHFADFYTTKGFDGEPSKYYKLENGEDGSDYGKFVQQNISTPFDINNTYAIRVDKELFTWQEKDNEGNLIPTEDIYIITGKKYYAKHELETKAEYVYDITEENCAMYDYLEDNLYLLIQVPKSYESSIVILEGNYLNTESDKTVDDSDIGRLSAPLVDYLYTSSLKLMEMPYSKPIPFSNTLIEFLLWNAINPLDSINNNMDRLLIAINSVLQYPISAEHYANYWYPQYRKFVSDIGKYHRNMVVSDNLGYVTRNLEQVINTANNMDSYIMRYPYED